MRYVADLDMRRTACITHVAQQMERRWFVERHARNLLRASERDVERDTATIRMPDQMHWSLARIDERQGLCGLIGDREWMLARPRSHAR